jgi:cytochrome c
MLRLSVAGWLLLANAAIALTNSASAQDLDTGRNEFLSKCATCHGADGKGDGPLGSKLKIKPPNLTILAKRNKGVFSQRALYEKIDGRKAPSHRGIEMPIWGCRHGAPPVPQKSSRRGAGQSAKKRLSQEQKQQKQQNRPAAILDLACDPEPVIRSRILAVVEYLRKIQEK